MVGLLDTNGAVKEVHGFGVRGSGGGCAGAWRPSYVGGACCSDGAAGHLNFAGLTRLGAWGAAFRHGSGRGGRIDSSSASSDCYASWSWSLLILMICALSFQPLIVCWVRVSICVVVVVGAGAAAGGGA